MTQDEIIEIARQAGVWTEEDDWFKDTEFEDNWNPKIEAFAKLVAAKKEAEMQDRIDMLHALYEQVCKQRDELMDAQRSMVAAMRGRMQ